MTSITRMMPIILLFSTIPLFSQSEKVLDICPDPRDDWKEATIDAVIDITVEMTVGVFAQKVHRIRNRVLAATTEVFAGEAIKLVIKKVILHCEHCGDFFCRSNVSVGDDFNCGDDHCVVAGVNYRVVSINKLRHYDGNVRLTVYNARNVPAPWYDSDPYVEIHAGGTFVGRTGVRYFEDNPGFVQSYLVNFSRLKKLKFLLKDRDLLGKDDLLCGMVFSRSLIIGRRLTLRFPKCSATMDIGVELLP